jgi:dihydroorotate dehydrogenase
MLSETLLRKLLLSMPPEQAHRLAMGLLKLRSYLPLPTPQTESPSLSYLGLKFPNHIGLAAGFDKNAECLLAWQILGFGFAEVGTVTALPQEGNPKPRIFRFPEQTSLLNRMGFNNDGCKKIAERITKQRSRHKIHIPIGVNIGKSKITPLEEADQDYLTSFRTLADLADYMVINVSSPNTPGLRNLQSVNLLKPLLDTLCSENAKRKTSLPLLLKLSPDLNTQDTLDIAELSLQSGLQGLIVSNTSVDFNLIPNPYGNGGLSGSVLFEKSTDCLRHIHTSYGDKLLLVGSGGVMSAEHARLKKEAGAKLIQIYTGFIYEGPDLIRQIATTT